PERGGLGDEPEDVRSRPGEPERAADEPGEEPEPLRLLVGYGAGRALLHDRAAGEEDRRHDGEDAGGDHRSARRVSRRARGNVVVMVDRPGSWTPHDAGTRGGRGATGHGRRP